MRRFVSAAVIVAATFALAGCSGSEDKTETKPTKAAAPAKSSTALPKVPEPNAAQTTALVTKLRAIKPELVVNEERAVRRSVNVCSDVVGKKDDATMAKNANFRFSGGTAGQLTDAQGAQIVDAVKATFCK
ncbi:hypothetical protein ACIRO1_36440 [Streptomyces sp. NPDC102381]|uniref:hypothetical protein n=1 Tax=Streptomyces sp. NPDC102381 TaxID=3366164 RepID=UPI0037F481F1